jgi:class 3 adenylate cyclase
MSGRSQITLGSIRPRFVLASRRPRGAPMSETRKIAAILVSDVVGYSRLAGADEERALARLRAVRSDLIDPCTTAASSSAPATKPFLLESRRERPESAGDRAFGITDTASSSLAAVLRQTLDQRLRLGDCRHFRGLREAFERGREDGVRVGEAGSRFVELRQ